MEMSTCSLPGKEQDLEEHTQQSKEASIEGERHELITFNFGSEQHLQSDQLDDDILTKPRPRSQSQSQSQTRSIRNSLVNAISRRASRQIHSSHEPFSHPHVEENTGAHVIVDFDGPDDPYRPMNWPFKKKVITTVLYGLTTCWITFASAIYSTGVQQIAHDFNVSMEVATAGISMVVFGFALGPLVWAPLSEVRCIQLAQMSSSRFVVLTGLGCLGVWAQSCGSYG